MRTHRNSDVDRIRYTRFRDLMSETGLTSAELAKRIDVSPNTVSAWMTRKREIPGAAFAYVELLASISRVINRHLEK